jgi:hypothetical protein
VTEVEWNNRGGLATHRTRRARNATISIFKARRTSGKLCHGQFGVTERKRGGKSDASFSVKAGEKLSQADSDFRQASVRESIQQLPPPIKIAGSLEALENPACLSQVLKTLEILVCLGIVESSILRGEGVVLAAESCE